MNNIINNTSKYLAVVSSLLLILDGDFELFLIIFTLGSLVSYISNNILVIVGAALIFVYLKEYNVERERENMAGAILAVVAGGFGAGIGGYYAGKRIDGDSGGKMKNVKDFIPSKIKKFRDKAFPGLLGNDSGSLISKLKEQNTKAILSLINPVPSSEEDAPGGSGAGIQAHECPPDEYLTPEYAYEGTGWWCDGRSPEICCGPPMSNEWKTFMDQPNREPAAALGVPCWAQKGDLYDDGDGNCVGCGEGKRLIRKTAACSGNSVDDCCHDIPDFEAPA